jgi:PAS domain S-box-containing protein
VKRILIVDDNADSRYSLRLLLEGTCEILEAGSGSEALERARNERPDCILLDVEMPGMSGFEACEKLKGAEGTRSIPVILVTAHHRDTESVVRGLAAGGDEYITKPVAQKELQARVNAMLRIRELQDQLEVLNAELESQVRRRIRELRQIYATVPVGIYTLDATGGITSFNHHLEEMLGYQAKEVVGKLGIGDLFEEKYDTLYWLDLCRREGHASCQGMARGKNGSLIPVFDERVVMIDHLGEHIGFTGYIQDLRQIERTRELLKEQEKQAGVGRLAATIVHEIANPISGVAHYLDAMLRRLEGAGPIAAGELRQGAQVMRNALQRTTDLIQHLRGLTRSAVQPVSDVDPMALLGDLQALMRYDLHRHGIKMVVKGAPGRHTVRADAGRLSQVFLNLITNARDAMPDGGTLTVDVRARDSTLATSFTDTGVGIPPENLDRIFEFLYTTKGAAGTGYGLTISGDIVGEHGGRIDVQSRVGEGSTFTVVLPLAPSGPPVA